MKHSVEHLSDDALSARLDALAASDRGTTVELLVHVAEFDRRKLYAPASYSSMHAYCVGRLRMSDDVAFARIRTARACHRFPGILTAIEDGRLNVTAVVLLAPHLKAVTREAGRELLRAAVDKRIREIRLLLAERFPQADVPTRLIPVGPPQDAAEVRQLGLNPVAANAPVAELPSSSEIAPISLAGPSSVAPVEQPMAPSRPQVSPLSPGRFRFQMTIGQGAHDNLQRLRALLSHQIPSGDLDLVVERALEIAVAQIEKQKYGATDRPRKGRSCGADSRHIPAEVRRAVRERDEERCTFVGADGKRCEATTMLEFDHLVPYAMGGDATFTNIRLRCRTHNQLEAEQVYGVPFMKHRREARAANGHTT